MPNYQNGKIYSIRSHSRPDLIYIGSTTQSLSRRFSKHKGMSNQCSSRQIIDLGDSYIELIEECKCDNKDQLLRREGQIMRSMDCVNKNIAGRTMAEYNHDNKERINEYYQENKEQISERMKKYRQDNKERINEYHKKYRQENKEKISQRIDCECGATSRRDKLTKHKQSKRHIHWHMIYEFIHS